MSDPDRSYPGFTGRVTRTFAGSRGLVAGAPDAARDGAPNIVIVLADDLGYADLGCYGSRDRHAEPRRARARAASRRTNFHVTPMCSPTRAALLTGLEPHRAGLRHRRPLRPRLPRLRDGARARRRRRSPRSSATRPATPRWRWGSGTSPRTPTARRRARSTRGRCQRGLRPLLRRPRRVHEPAPSAPPRRGQPPGRGRPLPRRLLLHRRHHRPRDLDDPRARRPRNPAQPFFLLLRARRGARAAARPARGHRRSTGAATTRAGTRCAPSGSPASRSSGVVPAGRGARAPQHRARTTTCGRGTTSPTDEQRAVRPAHGGLRRRWSTASTRTSAG